MKKIALLSLALLLVGCNQIDEGSGTQNSSTTQMQLETPYELHKGDKLLRNSSDTLVTIDKNSEKEYSTVTLLEGSAKIVWSNR